MGDKFDELIEQLSDEELKSLMIAFKPTLATMVQEEFEAILNRLMNEDVESAWQILIGKAAYATVKNELASLNASWKTLNAKMATNQKQQRDFLLKAISIMAAAASLV